MIHVALFSFQRTTWSFEACFLAFVWKLFASSDFYILSHRAELVKKFFLSFFQVRFGFLQIPCQSRLLGFCRCRISQRLVLWYSIQDKLSTPILKKYAEQNQNKKSLNQNGSAILLIVTAHCLVRVARVELTASWTPFKRATKLRYTRSNRAVSSQLNYYSESRVKCQHLFWRNS